mmetsp:Transcript_28911/g.52861  ORF Transcript_28911/g.52861 Transcript_28911/m.52861 type:complete len:560 (-) Transcript_28911:88-1767(-)
MMDPSDPSLSSDLDCQLSSLTSAVHLPQSNNASVCANSVLTTITATDQVEPITITMCGSQSPSRILMNVVLPIIFLVLSIATYMMYKRRQTRLELEGGMCRLPTVVWRPRFMNYTTQEDDGIHASGDELDWNNDNNHDAIVEWAKDFLKEHRSTCSTKLPTTTISNINNNINNINNSKKKKMGSSSITNILPRMERLDGPYGMYATVYGIQTKVIHVAHPVPARAILTGVGGIDIGAIMGDYTTSGIRTGGGGYGNNTSFLSYWKDAVLQILHRTTDNNDHRHQTTNDPSQKKIQQQKEQRRQLLRRKSSSLRMLTGSTKYPAYDHFKNFSGEGVFTANGSDWKAKRASVIHCLLRSGRSGGSGSGGSSSIGNGSNNGNNGNNGNGNGDDNTDRSLEMEANRAADSFEREVSAVTRGNAKSDDGMERKSPPVMNVVPMLQRSTIALVYRLITHRNVDFGTTPDHDDVVADVGKASSADLTTMTRTMTRTRTTDSLTSSSSATSLASSIAEGGPGREGPGRQCRVRGGVRFESTRSAEEGCGGTRCRPFAQGGRRRIVVG